MAIAVTQFIFMFLANIITQSSGASTPVYSNYFTKDNAKLFIDGPQSLSDRIAIVGAGVSGIHMATMLKKRGFSNIEIYEASDRIGGKSKTIKDRQNTVQELGSCCIGPGYENNIMKIINEYAPGTLVPRTFGSVWLDGQEHSISYGEYVIRESMKYFKTSNATEAITKLAGQVLKYIAVHKQLFPDYEFELMPRPKPETLELLRCSYLEFLRRNKVDGLVPLLILSHTLQGYGYLDEIGAVYGLLWNTPQFMGSFLKVLQGDNKPSTFMLKIGFQHLWERVASKNKLKIHFNAKIRKIHRNENIQVCDAHGCYDHDFLIWSPELKSSLPLFDPLYEDEDELFSAMSTDYLTSSLIRLEGGKQAPTPTSYWLDNLIKKRDSSVSASRNTLRAFEAGGAYPFKNNSDANRDKLAPRYELSYQYSPYRPCKPRRKLYVHFYEAGTKSVDINVQNVWRYFPHFSIDRTADGILWDILELQGAFRTWYIGSSVSFESLKSVVEYNKLLVSLMRPIQS